VEKEVIFLLCPVGTTDFDRLLCKNFELCNFNLLHHLNAYHVRYMCTKS
jgi:hypothetical protein